MEAFLTPVLVGAILTTIGGAIGWFVTYRNTLRLERSRRQEKVRDFQIALRAEIASELISLEVADLDEHLAAIASRYDEDPSYSVLVSQLSANLIFEAIVEEIHILPSAVIGPVVHYARFRQTTVLFASDLRDEKFAKPSPQRQLSMYRDYLEMLNELHRLADAAARALDTAMAIAMLNNRAEVHPYARWATAAASAVAAAWTSVSPDAYIAHSGWFSN